MIAVVCEEVVRGSQELVGDLFYDVGDLALGMERKALKDVGAKGASWRLEARFSPVYAGYAAFVVAAVCILASVDHNSAVEEATADSPKER